MARQRATSETQRNEMVGLADRGVSCAEISRRFGIGDQTVRNTIQRARPHAFKKGSVRGAVNGNLGVTQRCMPHQIGWSTDPTQSHLVSLPRLSCLEHYAY